MMVGRESFVKSIQIFQQLLFQPNQPPQKYQHRQQQPLHQCLLQLISLLPDPMVRELRWNISIFREVIK